MGNIGFSELIIIFMVVLLLFGAKRLPELARSMGKALREFKKASSELSDEISKEQKDETPSIQKEKDHTSQG